MLFRLKISAFVLMCAAMFNASASAQSLDAHEHGHVTLELAIDGNDVLIALEAPGESIVGFEHEATTDEQKAAVTAAMENLSDPQIIFTMPPQAACTPQEANAELHQEDNHNAFEVKYAFTCANIAALTSVQTNLFSLYPTIEEVDVKYATPAGQGAQELEADNPVIALPANT